MTAFAKKAALTALLGVGYVLPVNAETLRTASAFGASHIQATDVFATFNEKLEELTEARYSGRDFPSGLAAPGEMITALRDGVVDVGSVLMTYFPADFPESNLPTDLSIVGTDPIAIANATTEYLVTCAECQAEFSGLGQIYLGTGWTSSYQIQATSPIVEVEDLEGYRLRTAGSLYSAWAEYMGAQAVQMPSSEIFEALSQGTVDGFFANLPDLLNQQIQSLITDITLVDFGMFNGDSISVRLELWESLSEKDRGAFVRAAMYAREAGSVAWAETTQEAIEVAKAEGINFHDVNDAFRAKLDAFTQDHLNNMEQTLADRGVESGREKIDRYVALVEKWEGLMAEVGDDPEAIIALKMDEIWSKVDFSTYGL